jgi:hypothetical protein
VVNEERTIGYGRAAVLVLAWFCRLLWPFTDPGQRRELRSDLYVMF